MSITRYQTGHVARVKRAHGPDIWVYRWRDGDRHRAKTIGSVNDYSTKAEAIRASENLRSLANAAAEQAGKTTVQQAWGHFQKNELEIDRSPSTIANYRDYFKTRILPYWGHIALDDVKAVKVEAWLRTLTKEDGKSLAPATKAKIRNLLSALFSHCIRHELYEKQNPIEHVRQGAKRLREPDVLTLDEMQTIISHIEAPAVRVMVLVAAATALRRSELRGLQWADVDHISLWLHLRRGVVRKDITALKTEASKKGIPLTQDLSDLLARWRERTPYQGDEDWLFASPFTNGKRPYWCDSALVDHIRPAVVKAGVTKRVGWHTFRHSLATILAQKGENVKVVQELLRHANSRITLEIYQHAAQDEKRSALGHTSGLFVVEKVG